MFSLFFPGLFLFLMKVLTVLDFDIGVRLGVPYLQLLPPMVVGQIRIRAGMLDVLFPVDPGLVLRRWEEPLQFQQPERQEPRMLKDIRRDKEGDHENGEEVEEDQNGSPQPNAVENGEKSDDEEYVLL